MRTFRFIISVVLICLAGKPVFSQKWVTMMQDRNTNFYDVQKEFNRYYSEWMKDKVLGKKSSREKIKGEEDEMPGYEQFKRWEWFMEPRVYPTGKRFEPDRAWKEFQDNKQKFSATSSASNWTFLGPTAVPPYGGAGRINCIRFDPTNSNIIYICAPSGGLWKSTNGGGSWTQWNTDNLPSIGVSDIAIDPTNTQVMYLATGDAVATATYSIGVLKSIDGGITWNTTGLNWQVTQTNFVFRLQIDPTNTQIIHAATNNGMYRSTDGGANWIQTATGTGSFYEMVLKPGDPTTIYAAYYAPGPNHSYIYRSTDSGQSYSSVYSIPGSGIIDIAVTPANANYIYVVASNGSDGGFLGFYRSTNSGSSFTLQSSAPNILGRAFDGSDTGGQGFYDLTVASSPTNANEVIVGGINIWRSTDGGTTWTNKSQGWFGVGLHADQHDLIYLPGNGNIYYSGCDGGISITQDGGDSWSDLSHNLQIAQMYRLGQSASNGSLILSGWQDNGTNLCSGASWSWVIGGDGMECFIDRTNDSIMYGEWQFGEFQRSQDGGSTWYDISSGLYGGWITPWMQDPVIANTLWAGTANVFKSTDKGTTWTQMGVLPDTSSYLTTIDVAASNNQVIYVTNYSGIYKSTSGGANWNNMSAGLPIDSASITYLKISPTDANHVWVTFSGFLSGKKVFVTIDGGNTWINYSTGLPNLPVNCIDHEKGSNGGVYAGTDVGVYYRDNSLTSWIPFSTGLPNVVVDELEIQYAEHKIRAATYGRGMWESPLATVTGISEHYGCEENCMNIFPNPSSGEFDVQFHSLNGNNYTFELMDYLGQKIYSEKLKDISGSYKKHFDMGRFGKGIYLVTISDGIKRIQKKMVVL